MMKRLGRGSIAMMLAVLAAAAMLGVVIFFGSGDLARFASGSLFANMASIGRGRIGYETYCASCHGKRLEGQPDWKSPLPSGRLPAPPHDAGGHTWHHPDDVLAGIILRGLKPFAGEDYESDMPAFEGTLTTDQVGDIVNYIKDSWPERERGYQKRMTDQASGSVSAPSSN